MPLSSKKEYKIKEEKVSLLQIFSYQMLNDSMKFFYPKFPNLEKAIRKSRMPVPYEVYVCSMFMFSFISIIPGVIAGIIAMQYVQLNPEVLRFFLPALGGAGFFGLTFTVMQSMPSLREKTRAAKLEEELPHFMGYMSTLATSGLTLEGIFKAIAKEETEEEIVKDSRFVARNIDLMGMDLITAVRDLISRTPPGPYEEMLEGTIVTVQSGGDLKEYFNATAATQLEEKKNLLKKTTESLGSLAEIYTIMLIVFPLLAVIMLSIMGIMSPTLAGLDVITLLNILTFAVIPLAGILMLVMMDSMVPKR